MWPLSHNLPALAQVQVTGAVLCDRCLLQCPDRDQLLTQKAFPRGLKGVEQWLVLIPSRDPDLSQDSFRDIDLAPLFPG